MPEIGWVAVLLCGISTLVIGGVWYSPLLFANAWQRGARLSDETLKQGNMAMRFGVTFLLGLIASVTFAMFIDSSMTVG